MNKIVQDKMQRQIMVVKNEILFLNTPYKQGFIGKSDNYEEIIINHFEYMKRGEAEKNFEYKQPIPYGVVINDKKQIFVYKRGNANSNAGEQRLHSKISFGVGGHIEMDDEISENILRDTLCRELKEEIFIQKNDIKKIEILGYINDDSNEVGKVHFGVCYIVEITNTKISMEDGELENGEFLSISQIEEMMKSDEYDVENWSQIIYDEIKNSISK